MGFLGLRKIECRNFSEILEWGLGLWLPYREETSHYMLPIICKPPGTYTPRYLYPKVPIASNHGLSLLVHHSSLHHNSLGSIHIKLLSCWVESTHPFAARVVDSRTSILLHPSGGHNCLTRCRLHSSDVFETTGLCGVQESYPWTPVWTPIQLLAVDMCA